MTTVKAREKFLEVLERAANKKERIVITRGKKKLAAIVPMEDMDLLERWEDEIDVRDAKKALREKGKSIPWTQIKKDLGL
jgi:prevent-host-death family protein